MWYFILHATDLSLCSGRYSRGAPAIGERTPVRRSLSRTALPGRAGQRVGCRGAADCTPSGGQRPNRAQCRARVQSPGGSVSAAQLLAAPHHTRAVGERGSSAAPGVVAPESSDLRPSDQSVDLRVSRRGEFCPRPHPPAGQSRSDPHGFAPLGGELAASQGLDYQSRLGVYPQKKARDRLIRLVASHPEWALGFEDETWWSRVAQPALHAWAPAQQPLRLIEQTVPSADPDPKLWLVMGCWCKSGPSKA
jgi:hypothetical protein